MKLFDIIEETGRKCSWISGEEVMGNKKKYLAHPRFDQMRVLDTMDLQRKNYCSSLCVSGECVL